jgi:hypothetical protein
MDKKYLQQVYGRCIRELEEFSASTITCRQQEYIIFVHCDVQIRKVNIEGTKTKPRIKGGHLE